MRKLCSPRILVETLEVGWTGRQKQRRSWLIGVLKCYHIKKKFADRRLLRHLVMIDTGIF
jgi:hypothetical protein